MRPDQRDFPGQIGTVGNYAMHNSYLHAQKFSHLSPELGIEMILTIKHPHVLLLNGLIISVRVWLLFGLIAHVQQLIS